MRMLTDEISIFECEPHNDLLGNRSWNEAYCTANPGLEYGVFFPDGGNVLLDASAVETGTVTVRWLDIRGRRWMDEAAPVSVTADGTVRLVTPTEEGYWAALVKSAVPAR